MLKAAKLFPSAAKASALFVSLALPFGLVLFTTLNTGCSEKDFNSAVKTATDAYNANGGSTDALSPNVMGMGLREALQNGIERGVSVVAVPNGFWGDAARRILLPPQAQDAEAKLRQLGLGNLVDNALEKINHAAEDAAGRAKPIFVQAITNLTFDDAKNILFGQPNAATEYLKRTTSTALYASFKPIINTALNQGGALKAWNDVTTAYNKIPFVERINPDLADHVTNKTMEGLFTMVEREERDIRKDPIKRTTDILRKVFKAQDK